MFKKFVFVLFVVAGLIAGGLAYAQDRSYSYDAIKFELRVNPNTTVDVTEKQTYRFNGEYHQGWRDIPLSGVSAITDVQVLDGSTGQALIYSPRRLEKTDPQNWDKFAVFRQNGSQVIEWYYDASDTTREWILKYKLHGALSFLKDHDELYWNLFTSYEVPVNYAEATVILPENQFSITQLQLTGYGEPVVPTSRIIDNRTFFFQASNLPPLEKLTIAAGWPLGLVDHGAFWRDWLWRNLLYFFSGLIVLGTIVYSFCHWYVLEYKPEHSRTIVPEYVPPRDLRPAMAEVIVREGVGVKTWSATIVDLAVRGYLKIEEIEKKGWFFKSKDYRLIKLKEFDMENTDGYERVLIAAIFDQSDSISLKELEKRNQKSSEGVAFVAAINQVKKTLYHETDKTTKAYAVGMSEGGRHRGWIFLMIIAGGVLGGFLWKILGSQINFLFITLVASAIWIYTRRYEARLSPEGMQLKREILGFKLYLKTAERYRLQNLTPDLFEKFLPYAIIFGVEKKWAGAFAGMTIPAPQWYASNSAAFGISSGLSGPVGGFSASVFSASFSSSFTSAFSSSAGGGASGGGGGAGGGGGGGGGGAS